MEYSVILNLVLERENCSKSTVNRNEEVCEETEKYKKYKKLLKKY